MSETKKQRARRAIETRARVLANVEASREARSEAARVRVLRAEHAEAIQLLSRLYEVPGLRREIGDVIARINSRSFASVSLSKQATWVALELFPSLRERCNALEA